MNDPKYPHMPPEEMLPYVELGTTTYLFTSGMIYKFMKKRTSTD